MSQRQRQARGIARIGGLILVASLALSLSVGTAQAAKPAPKPAPQLSISIDDGRTDVSRGDLLTYSIVVTNVGTKPVKGLWLTQTLPTGLRPQNVDAKGVTGKQAITWRVDVAPAAKSTVHSRMRVTSTPKDLLRLAPVACASVTRTGRSIVCASHSDQLPAGAAQESVPAAATTSSSGFPDWGYGAFVALVLVIAGGVVLLLRRRRRVST